MDPGHGKTRNPYLRLPQSLSGLCTGSFCSLAPTSTPQRMTEGHASDSEPGSGPEIDFSDNDSEEIILRRDTRSESALIRFLTKKGVSATAIRDTLGYSLSTVSVHKRTETTPSADRRYISGKFYKILGQFNAGSGNMVDSGAGKRRRSGRQVNLKHGNKSVQRSSKRLKERVASRSLSSRSSSALSDVASHSSARKSIHSATDNMAFLRTFIARANLGEECIEMLASSGLTTDAKLGVAAEMEKDVFEQFVALHMPEMKPFDKLLFLAALAKMAEEK
ncbi:hypothetical protein DFH06DRAFT_1197683 [Mycena polygramma]|nr:hypothetical protein DFH06DRAFT_1197683 [Mycena polygramma]